MRKKFIPLTLALCLTLAGCGNIVLERSYSVSAPHSEVYWENENADTLRADSYQDLVNALLLLLGEHSEEGTVRIYGNDEAAASMAEQACREVQEETALGAYLLEYISYTDAQEHGYYEMRVRLGYRRTAAQVAGLVHITSTSALGDLLREAARNHAAELVVQVGYFDHQAEEVRTQVTQIQAEVEPESKEPWTVNFYPDSGNAGIIEVLLSGAGSAEGAEQNTKNAN